ncbi:hypothetical protein SAMN05216480_105225 [Pustulibacterium marinum]|uniref:Lipid A deacylase LpxR family protein n=1 Tax=Pustulibacterium marinum TaxID=1224947 RepID=A0A1I7GS50_9FLAO|nr:lipid A-modifier LpxR family protein [Pustulibacterium marinum]SFU51265.1 hypothetical protein SAMN05216480_105225 [Pustulibacterium marinum]
MKQLCCLFYLFGFLVSAQENQLIHQVGLQIDNDLFVPQEEDNYYTSGIIINYTSEINSFLFLERRENERMLLDASLMQQLYTPIYPNSTYLDNYDRPFAGWLAARLQLRKLKDEKTFIYGLEVGVTGNASFGRQLHQGFHDLMHIEEKPEWLAQIPSEIMMNVNFGYAYELKKWFVPSIKTTAGTKDIYIEPDLLFLINMDYDSFLLPDQKTKLSGYFNTNYRLVGYNALIDGSMFYKKPIVAKKVAHHLWSASAGVQLQVRNFGFRIAYMYTTKETKEMHYHLFGSVKMFYLF